MLTFKLAGRNLWRHKRRTIITSAAIIFSYALLVLFMGIAEGGHRQMIDMGVRMGSGHVVIQAQAACHRLRVISLGACEKVSA